MSEIHKYPYNGRTDDTKKYLSEKVCCCIVRIPKRAIKNREAVYLFVRKLPSNSKGKAKKLFVYGMFIFQLGQPLVPSAATVGMSLPLVAIHRLSPFKSFKSPSSLDLILKLNGGSEEDLNEEDEKLVKSVLAKTPQSDYKETSINKCVKKVVDWIEPIISDSTFWRIVNQSGKPVKSKLYISSSFISRDIRSAKSSTKHQPLCRKPGSVSFFISTSPNPKAGKISPMRSMVQAKMAAKRKNNSSTKEAPKPSPPTGKLTKQAIQNNDATTKMISPIEFNDWEGESRAIKSKELKKLFLQKAMMLAFYLPRI
jgi:hypothetical protein